MLRWLKRIVVAFIFVVLLIIIAGPWALYYVGLNYITLLPKPPELVEVPSDDWRQASLVWHRFKEDGLIRLTKQTPYALYIDLWLGEDYRPGGSRISWYVAKHYNHLNGPAHGLEWQLSRTALALWLTQHWTINELIEKAQEIYVIENCGPQSYGTD